MNRQTALQILLVDDEDIVHQTIGDYLQESGHKVESAFDGEAALRWIEAEECDLALIDVRLADMDGLDLLASVQENYPDIAVVIITGHGSMETAIRALRLGVADFLPKPVKLLDLDAVLEKAVRLRDLRNLVDRAVMLCGAGQILSDHLNLPQSRDERAIHRAAATDERSAILSALEEARWNAAKRPKRWACRIRRCAIKSTNSG